MIEKHIVAWGICGLLLMLVLYAARRGDGQGRILSVIVPLVVIATMFIIGKVASCYPLQLLGAAAVFSAWTLPISLAAYVIIGRTPMVIGFVGGVLSIVLMTIGVSEGTNIYHLGNLPDIVVYDKSLWTLLVLAHGGALLLSAVMIDAGRRDITPDSNAPKCHSGAKWDIDRRFFPSAPEEIGTILSGESGLPEGGIPWSLGRRVQATAIATFTAAWFGYFVGPCLGEHYCLLLAVIGAGLGIASFWKVFDQEYCTYVGTGGCAIGTLREKRGHVSADYRVFLFQHASYIYTERVAYYNIVASKWTYISDDYDFLWTDEEHREVFRLRAKSSDVMVGDPKQPSFAEGTARSWTEYLLVKVKCAEKPETVFPIRSGTGRIVVTDRIVYWAQRQEAKQEEIVHVAIDGGNVVLELKSGKKPERLRAERVANLELLLTLAQTKRIFT